MTNIKQFIDEHDLTVEDVIDALDIDAAQFADVPDEPTDFYDGEPSADDLAEDFDAVDLLVDEKADLEDTVDSLREDLREAKRPVYRDKAEELAELTDKWGDTDILMDRFDPEDPDEDRWTVDDLEDKIELVEDIKGEDITTVDSDSEGSESSTSDPTEQFDTTPQGKIDLRQRTKVDEKR